MRGSHTLILCIFLTSALAACGGSDNDDSGSGSNTGQASVAVTDAPVDGATRVVVEFTAVELKPQAGESILFELSAPQQIDLLALQGSEFEPLIQDETVPAGPYNWIRLHVNDNDCDVLEPGTDPSGSFVELEDGGIEPLHIPSGSQSGLKLVSGFTVAAGGQTDLTIDFDVRKSLTAPEGQACHFLKPALRVVDNAMVGHISGVVSPDALVHDSCLDPESVVAVYLFEGADITADDIDGMEAEPLTSALVDEVTGTYEIGFVLAGEHTLALTCDADLDDPETDDPEVMFISEQNVTVEAETTINADF